MKIDSFFVINSVLIAITVVALFYHPESHLLWVALGFLALISIVGFVENRRFEVVKKDVENEKKLFNKRHEI